ncbi:MAG: hypothetical protein QY332_18550 [Anaerolineales bacterium]|nr:MAG: hypothetical protein QY332_18550 [Anaerolineales bacterium]
MNRVLFSLLIALLIAACAPIEQLVLTDAHEPAATQTLTASQAAPQSIPAPENTPLPDEINAPLVDAPSIINIEMVDEIYGWGTTEQNLIRTNDGGVTWYHVTPPGMSEVGYSVTTEFLDVSHAWVQAVDPDHYPRGGTLYRTSDGGITWEAFATPFSDGDMEFVDTNNGWMMAGLGVGAGSMAVSIFQTNDGGETWDQVYTNDPNLKGAGETLPLGGLKGMLVPLNMQTAWVGGVIYSSGSVYLFRTDDAGETWFKISLALPGEAQASELSIEELVFVSPTQGFLAIRMSSVKMQTIFYATNDGGDTWSLAPVTLPGAGRLEILSAQEIIFYSDDRFYVTKDAGSTFSIIPPDIAFGELVTDMSFANSSTGWVVTTDLINNRTLYKTIDGGLTWYPIIP